MTHHRMGVGADRQVLQVRESGIQLLGRLVRHNPALVIPALRSTLAELLTEIECGSNGPCCTG